MPAENEGKKKICQRRQTGQFQQTTDFKTPKSNKIQKQNSTDDACHGQSLLKMAQKHFSLVKHLCGFVISFLRMNEDGAEEKSHLILQP